MVNYSPARLDATFAALADPLRRAMLARLAAGECPLGELARPFNISLPGVMKHLRVLERSGLVETEKQGRVRRCRLVPERLRDAAGWIAHYERFWPQQFDSLDRYLKSSRSREERSWPSRQQVPESNSKSGAPSRRRAKRSSRPGPRRKP